jgi:hypothetical protein
LPQVAAVDLALEAVARFAEWSIQLRWWWWWWWYRLEVPWERTAGVWLWVVAGVAAAQLAQAMQFHPQVAGKRWAWLQVVAAVVVYPQVVALCPAPPPPLVPAAQHLV